MGDTAFVVPRNIYGYGQILGVVFGGSIIQHTWCSSHNWLRISGPSDSGIRSISGDRGEGELKTGSNEV